MKRPFGSIDDSRLNSQPARLVKPHASLCSRGQSRCLRDTLLNRSFGLRKAQQSSFSSVCYLDSLGMYSIVDDRLDLWDGDIPFAVSCAHTCSLTAVGQEGGGVHVLDHSQSATSREEGPFLFDTNTHQNAIFDVEWSADDRWLASASGDQTVSLLDVSTQKVLKKLHGHSSSVKEVKFDPTNSHICVTGGRDGRIAVWDLRESDTAGSKPVAQITSAHGSVNGDTRRNGRTNNPAVSITALLYKPNGQLVSACASNPILMSWDLRYLRTEVSHSPSLGHYPLLDASNSRPTQAYAAARLRAGKSSSINAGYKRERTHGVTSLALSSNGQKVYSMNRNNRVYEYQSSHEDAGPTKVIEIPDLVVRSFYSKCSISNDGLLICGNANGSPIIIDTNRAPDSPPKPTATMSFQDQENLSPQASPSSEVLKKTNHHSSSRTARQFTGGHQQECTGLSWSHDSSVFVSIGDDASTRIWRRDERLRGHDVLPRTLGSFASDPAWL